MKSYDLVIIGSGPGGYVAALYASHRGKRVCVIEKSDTGGTCLNKGCIPTKSMLHSASVLSNIRDSIHCGIEVSGYKIDFPAIQSRKTNVVERLRSGIETLFRANKIDLVKGAGVLKDANTVTAGKEDYNAKDIIIATGSVPAALPGIEYDEIDICSSEGVLNLKDIPKSIVVAGGGVIGCEFAGLFNVFGAGVTIVEMSDRLLPMQSKEVSRKLETIFKKRGIAVYTSTKLESIAKDSRLKLKISNGQTLESQKLLISVGRKANIEDIGLEALGIDTCNGRIVVDERLRTSVKNVYAIGDCVSGPLLAHKASYDGILACDNILGNSRAVDYSNVPNCIWTDPEIAGIGLSEEEAKAKYPDARAIKFSYLASGKALIMGRTEGFIKMIGSPDGSLLGVEILGVEACDLIGEAALAKSIGVNIRDWSKVIHGHPTLSEIFQEAARIFCGD